MLRFAPHSPATLQRKLFVVRFFHKQITGTTRQTNKPPNTDALTRGKHPTTCCNCRPWQFSCSQSGMPHPLQLAPGNRDLAVVSMCQQLPNQCQTPFHSQSVLRKTSAEGWHDLRIWPRLAHPSTARPFHLNTVAAAIRKALHQEVCADCTSAALGAGGPWRPVCEFTVNLTE